MKIIFDNLEVAVKIRVLITFQMSVDYSLKTDYQVILFYKFVDLDNLEELQKSQLELCKSLGLKGRVLLASEGVNGTLEGSIKNIQTYINNLKKDPRFDDILFKKSPGLGNGFAKMQVKIKPEVVALDSPIKYDAKKVTAKFIESDELHKWFQEKREFFILDMRNDYETKVGQFENSLLLPNFKNFRELPDLLPHIEQYKNKTIVTCCTGGIRCEKGTGLLLESGFSDVYQLKDGIVTYMEKYPNQNFLGKLFVFDNRLMVAFNTDSKEHTVIGKCDLCGQASENIENYLDSNGVRQHGIACQSCLEKGVVIRD